MPEPSPSTNSASTTPARPPHQVAVLLLIVAIAFGGNFFAEIGFPDLIFENETLHTFLESIGAVSALTLTIMIMLSQSGQDDSSLAFVSAAGLICMSVFDALHSVAQPGSLFVWLRSSSTFLGGFFFALSWITPNHWLARSGKRLVGVVLLLALLLGLGSMVFASNLPPMLQNGEFTFTACAINFIGGLLFLAASARYLRLHRQSQRLQDLFYIALCMLLGISGILFPYSHLWHIDWWFWHFLRLMAYFFVLGHLFLLLRQGKRSLLQSRAELAQAVDARTRELAQSNALLEAENRKLQESDRENERAMALLRTSEERWAFALEGSGDGVWDWDLLQNKLQLSNRWKEIFGYTTDEIGDAPSDWFALIHPEDLADVMAVIEANQDGNTRSFSSEHRMRHKNGQYLWMQARGMVVARDANGLPLRIIGTHSDISDRKQIERMKNAFISTVSHELRTPLTSIRGSLSLLENGVLGELPPKAMDIIRLANKNSVRLITLVNDILDMDKLLSGQMTIHNDPLDLAALVAQAIEVNTGYATAYKVRYQMQAAPQPCIVTGDHDRLMQVMANLLSNAAKFSKPEQVVEVRIVALGAMMRVEIQDHGIGIAEEFRSRIFEEFAQANSTNTRHNGGTGLGLNITKKLVEKMDGAVGYDTVVGQGTTFWFTLPVCLKGLLAA